MPHTQLIDPLLQKIAPLPIPEAIKMLELVTPDSKRNNLAVWLARLWHGGVHDIPAARQYISSSTLDEESKAILTKGLAG